MRYARQSKIIEIIKNQDIDTQEKLAEALDLSVSGVNQRINGKVEWRRSEINTIRRRYSLSPEDTIRIFFTEEVS